MSALGLCECGRVATIRRGTDEQVCARCAAIEARKSILHGTRSVLCREFQDKYVQPFSVRGLEGHGTAGKTPARRMFV